MRVIAGRLGGRTLVAPRGLATRPTTDRVREALFSILGDVTGARVLDLYAGTGALGIEALSRGAASCAFVESARPALVALRKNLADLGLQAVARALAEPAARAVARLRSEPDALFDLVLCDPPYEVAEAALTILESLGPMLASGARVVLEHAARSDLPESSVLGPARRRVYGDTALAFFEPPARDGQQG